MVSTDPVCALYINDGNLIQDLLPRGKVKTDLVIYLDSSFALL